MAVQNAAMPTMQSRLKKLLVGRADVCTTRGCHQLQKIDTLVNSAVATVAWLLGDFELVLSC